jgi:hypothetical protein
VEGAPQLHLLQLPTSLLPLLLLQTCSQVLLTLDNLADRSQYINARNTFTELLAYGTIPVVNENVRAVRPVAMQICSLMVYKLQHDALQICGRHHHHWCAA